MNKRSFTLVRNAFLSGLLLLAPLAATLYVFDLLFGWIGGSFRPIFQPLLPESLAQFTVLWNILATIIVLVMITTLGYLSRYVFGQYLGGLAERFIQSIPGVNTVYNTVKQIVETFSTQNRNLFSKVVLVQFPRAGSYTVGFLTNRTQGEAQVKTSRELWTVFVPTTPNPTSGFMLLLPPEEIIDLEMSVGDGMKMVISGGSLTPPFPGANRSSSKPPLQPDLP
jgi:uncharacterized membrane protein